MASPSVNTTFSTLSLPGWLRTSSLNMGLRALTLGSKFVLLLFMARYLAPADLGLWGLVTTSINLSMFVLGLEFYVFNARELLARDRAEWPRLIRDQLVFHGLIYLLALPLLLGLFAMGLLPWQFAAWFYLLLILEHLAQEAYRLFSTLSRPLVANCLLLFRSGAWIYVVIGIMAFQPGTRSLPLLWLGWALGSFFSLGLAAFHLRDLPWAQALRQPIDWSWIRRGAMGALPFLGSALALTAIESIDRYFLKYFHGEALVGAYSFYGSLTNAVQVFLFSGVIMIIYPKVIQSFQQGDLAAYRQHMRSMSLGICLGLLVLVSLAAVGIFLVLMVANKEIYRTHLAVYWVMLATVSIACLGMIPHYALYARRHDRTLTLSAFLALAVAVLMNWLLVPPYGVLGAALSTLAATATVALSKLGMLVYLERA